MAAAPIWCQGGLRQALAPAQPALSLPAAGHNPLIMARKDEERAQRLAAALRENLRRRKAQARAIAEAPERREAGPEAGGED